MLTGDITLLLNMTLNEMLANMTLVTTSSPALFTMPGNYLILYYNLMLCL